MSGEGAKPENGSPENGSPEKRHPGDKGHPGEKRHREEGRPEDRGHYPCRIPIRMTAAERAVIGKSACAADLSVSRYLVELATQGRVARPEDRARLRYLQALFQDAAARVQALLSSPLMAHEDVEIQSARACLEEASRLLTSLARELTRRLA